jgi:ADP-ribose pyrophosphatase
MRVQRWKEAEPTFHGVRFDVHALELPRRDGGTMRREVIVPRDAVVILPLLDIDAPGAAPGTPRIVLIQNQRFSVGRTLIELPAGTMEVGEEPLATAARELEEESGYRADTLELLAAFHPTPGFCTELMHLYLARGLTHVGQHLDETEHIEPLIVPFDEALNMVKDGRIVDGKTIVGLLWYQTFFRQRAQETTREG